MQFIENSELLRLSQTLSQLRVGSYYLSSQLESFLSSYGSYTTLSKSKRSHARRQISSSSSTSHGEGTNGESHDGVSPASDSSHTRNPVISVETLKKPARRRTSSLGDLSEPSSRALLMDFVYALNEAFPDHDFADSKIEQFKECDTADFMRSVNSFLAETTLQVPGLLEQLWGALDEAIDLRVCEVFSFTSDAEDELEDEDDNLWAFHYFLFNKDLDKLVYFTCSARSTLRKARSAADVSLMLTEDEDDEDDLKRRRYNDDDDDEAEVDEEGERMDFTGERRQLTSSLLEDEEAAGYYESRDILEGEQPEGYDDDNDDDVEDW